MALELDLDMETSEQIEKITQDIKSEDARMQKYREDLALLNDAILVVREYNFSEDTMDALNKTMCIVSCVLKESTLHKALLLEELEKLEKKH